MKKVLTVLVVLALASASQAALVAYRDAGTAVTTEDGSGIAYEIYLKGDTEADWVAAIDGGFTGNLYHIGFMLTASTGIDTPTLASMNGIEYDPDGDTVFNNELDSHFVAAFNAMETAPNETNNRVFVPAPAKYAFYRGLGQLSVTSGIDSAAITEQLHLAHVVLLAGDTATLTAGVANGAGAKTFFTEVAIVDLPIIPEPATMLLVVIGAAGVISRRRRA